MRWERRKEGLWSNGYLGPAESNPGGRVPGGPGETARPIMRIVAWPPENSYHPPYLKEETMGGKSSLVFILVVIVLSGAASALAAGPKAFPVTVVNPPTSPVPVSINGSAVIVGDVAVTNTPNVKVANEVAVRIVDMPSLVPFRSDRHLTLPDSITSIQGPFETVPGGTRVVLEYVTFYCTTRPGDSMLNVGIGVSGVAPDGTARTMFYRFPLQKAAADHGGLTRWHSSQAVRLYADPGEIRYEAGRTGEGDFWACDVAVSGQAIALP
jgi:hypothetical protein